MLYNHHLIICLPKNLSKPLLQTPALSLIRSGFLGVRKPPNNMDLLNTSITAITLAVTAVSGLVKLDTTGILEQTQVIVSVANQSTIKQAVDRYILTTDDYSILQLTTEEQTLRLKASGILQ